MRSALLPLALSTLSMAATTVAWAGTPAKVIFLIHGYKGSPDSFCSTRDYLDQALTAAGQDTQITYANYDTQNTDLTETEAVKQVNREIQDYFNQNGLPLDTPFGLLMHSQGGVVGMKYVKDCINNTDPTKACEGHPPQNLVQFVTLATPFWGSPAATGLVYDKLVEVIGHFPQVQAEQLSFANTSVDRDRHGFEAKGQMWAKPGQWTSVFPPSVQVYNFSGDISDIFPALYGKPANDVMKATGLLGHQTDLVVDVASARPDFHYYIENATTYQPEIGTTEAAPGHYVPTNFAHLRLGKLDGIACMDPDNQKSRVLLPYLASIFEGKPPNFAQLVKDAALHPTTTRLRPSEVTFEVEAKMYLPPGYSRNIKMSPKMIGIRDPLNRLKTVVIPNTLTDIFNKVEESQAGQSGPRYATLFHLGEFFAGDYVPAKNLAIDGKALPPLLKAYTDYLVQAPGWRTKRFTLPVSPTYSTYAEVHLFPVLPLAPSPADLRQDPRYLPSKDGILLKAYRIDLGAKQRMVWLSLADHQLHAENLLTPLFNRLIGSPKSVLEQGTNLCYRGTVGSEIDSAKAHVYQDYLDDQPAAYTPKPGEKLRILGRLSEGDWVINDSHVQLAKRDRYLVTSEWMSFQILSNFLDHAHGLYWIDVADVDVDTRVNPANQEVEALAPADCFSGL